MLLREDYLSKIRGFYDSDLIKILVGIRRCGKSVILNQIIEELKDKRKIDEEHIIFINFEFIEFEDLLDYKKLNKYIKNKIKDNKIYYLFLDEIQNVDNFEKVVNSLRASIKNISIFLTGSNSKMLSDELSSVLSGRYVLFNINPLSYKEYVSLTKKDGNDLNTFWDYAKWGGLPNRCEFTNEIDIKNYLHSVYDSIILRDVVKRLNLKDTVLFDMILQYLIETAGREFSADNIIKYLDKENKKISNETLYNYIDALCKALILKKVYRYDIAGKGVLKTLPMTFPYTDADYERFIKSFEDEKNEIKKSSAQFIIDVNGKAVGCVSLSWKLRECSKHKASLGYWLGKKYWGQGIMTEAVKILCDYAFNELGKLKLYIDALEDNIGSRKVAEKNMVLFPLSRHSCKFLDGSTQ